MNGSNRTETLKICDAFDFFISAFVRTPPNVYKKILLRHIDTKGLIFKKGRGVNDLECLRGELS